MTGCKHFGLGRESSRIRVRASWRAWRLPGRWPDGGLSEGYVHGGPGVCLGDGQTEAEGVGSQLFVTNRPRKTVSRVDILEG